MAHDFTLSSHKIYTYTNLHLSRLHLRTFTRGSKGFFKCIHSTSNQITVNNHSWENPGDYLLNYELLLAMGETKIAVARRGLFRGLSKLIFVMQNQNSLTPE